MMKRLALVALLFPATASADVQFSSAAVKQIQLGLTQGVLWGAPRYATASLPTCDSTQTGAVAYDTTAATLKVCGGSSWASAGGGTSVGDDVIFNLGTTAGNTNAGLEWNTTQTPDTAMFLTGSTSNHFVLAERADASFDFAHAAATDPTLFIHSHNQSTSQWLSLYHNGSNGIISSGVGDNSGINLLPDAASSTNGFTVFRRGSSATIESNTAAVGEIYLDRVAGGGYGFYNAAFGVAGSFAYNTVQTPDTFYVGVPSSGNSVVVAEQGDKAFDFAHALQTDPTVFVHSHNQSSTEYAALRSAGLQSEQSKTLTESSATSIVQIGIAASSFVGGTLEYTVVAADATDQAARHGRTIFQAVNKAGTETCTISPTAETTDGSTIAASSGSTLTYTWTVDTTGTNMCTLALNAVSSLTQTTLRVYYTLILDGPATVTPQ